MNTLNKLVFKPERAADGFVYLGCAFSCDSEGVINC